MKTPHLLSVEDGPEQYLDLITAARELGLRVGWLDWTDTPVAAAAPGDLPRAAAGGVLRAVAVGPDGTVAVKPRSGPPVLRDVLREHFLGCRLVLVRGAMPETPALTRDGESYRLGDLRLAAPELAERLRRPRLLGSEESDRRDRVARITTRAAEVLEDEGRAASWLRAPNRALGGAVPLRLLQSEEGTRRVEAALGRIEHGIFS